MASSAQVNNRKLEQLLRDHPELSLEQCAALLVAEDDAKLDPVTLEIRNRMRMEVASRLPHIRQLLKPTKEK